MIANIYIRLYTDPAVSVFRDEDEIREKHKCGCGLLACLASSQYLAEPFRTRPWATLTSTSLPSPTPSATDTNAADDPRLNATTAVSLVAQKMIDGKKLPPPGLTYFAPSRARLHTLWPRKVSSESSVVYGDAWVPARSNDFCNSLVNRTLNQLQWYLGEVHQFPLCSYQQAAAR